MKLSEWLLRFVRDCGESGGERGSGSKWEDGTAGDG